MTNQEKLLSAFKKRRPDDFQELVKYQDVDVDYFYGEPDNGTLLDLANRSLYNEVYVSQLIKCGARLWRKDEENGKLEIHEIFNSSDQDLLYCIWCGVYYSLSSTGNENANVMKVAVEENDIEAIALLAHSYSIIHDRFNVGRPEGQHLILLRGSIDAVRLFIKYFDVDIEFQKDSQGRVLTCREIILQIYPELQTELPTRSPSELQEILFSYLRNGAPELFLCRIAEIGTEILNDGREKVTKMTYLHVACELNNIDVVNALLKKNVHLNEIVPCFNEFAQNATPIMLAAFFGHYEIFSKFYHIPCIGLQNKGGSGSVLHLVLHGVQFMQDRNCSTEGHRMILVLLLELYELTYTLNVVRGLHRLDVNYTDKSGRTALNYALKFNNEFAIRLILGAGAKLFQRDQSILTSTSVTIIEGYFDSCIRSYEDNLFWIRDDVDLPGPMELHFKIFTQLDLYSIATKSNGNFFARFESVTEMRKLYKRPLTKSFLYVKWCLVKKSYFINLAFYLSFCLALSTFIFQIHLCPPSSADFNSSELTDTANHHNASSILLWTWLITLLFYITLILRELGQFFISIQRYFGMLENWLEMTMIVVIGFLFANETNTYLASIAILTSWVGFMLLLGKQPSLSIYIEMFKTVALNFAKFLLLYSILIASFAYSFFILFRNKTSGHVLSQNQFNVNTTDRMNENSVNWWHDLRISFFKSIIMMTGEFEASSLPLNSNFGYGHVFFIFFVFLVTMVLYNLLNGLAVSDTRAIMEDAEIVALISRAKLISQIERLASSNPFHHAFRCRMGYKFLRNKLFGDEILFNESMPVYVYSSESNRIEIDGKNVGKMPSTIVKHAEEVLEVRKRFQLAKNENENSLTNTTKNNPSDSELRSVSEQISNLKLEIDAKIAARDEKLLKNVDKMLNNLLNAVLQEVNLLKNKD